MSRPATSAIIGTALLCLGAVAVTFHHHQQIEQASRPVLECRLSFSTADTDWLPVATTAEQQERGLSAKANVGPGMLFNWTADERRRFWMKDTHQALSIAFIDGSGTVRQVLNMAAESEIIHTSAIPAREAIEMPIGRFQELGIAEGSQILSRDCRSIGSKPV